MLRRYAIQVLRGAGHTLDEIAQLVVVGKQALSASSLSRADRPAAGAPGRGPGTTQSARRAVSGSTDAARKQTLIVADGRRVERDIGYALVRAAGSEAPDLLVFAEPGDVILLGSHSLEGLNLRVDPVRKALVAAGPVIAASAA